MKQENTTIRKDISQQEMLFITEVKVVNQPGITQHGGSIKTLTRKTEEIRNDLSTVMNQLGYIVSQAEKSTENNDFKLDEITISLGFTAEGGIAFIAKAGIEASIEVKFTRK